MSGATNDIRPNAEFLHFLEGLILDADYLAKQFERLAREHEADRHALHRAAVCCRDFHTSAGQAVAGIRAALITNRR